jgi:nucleotide-binding universal stress UspA family protein
MLRRLLVGLDPSEINKAAVETACYYARLVDATVVGVGIVDGLGIEHSEYGGGIGTDYYVEKAVKHRLEEARRTVERIVGEFERTCVERKVRHESSVRTGRPADELLELANGADLLVSGNRTYFEFATHDDPDDTIHRVLRMHGVPVLAMPEGVVPPFHRAVIACDSSPAAVRALRSFVYQTWDRPFHPDVILVRVADDPAEGERALEHPRRFLEAYGFKVQPLVEPGPVTEKLRELAAAEPPSLLVLGSRGRWAPLEALFGSTTRELLEEGTIPLLIAA